MSDQKEEPNQAIGGDSLTEAAAAASAAELTAKPNTTQADGQERESVTIEVSQSNQPATAPSGFGSTLNRCKDSLLNRPIQYDIVSIIYTVLVIGGGLYGYVAKESLPSLAAGIISGIALAFAIYLEGNRKFPYPLLVVLLFLNLMFGYRYYKKDFKFMPSGFFTLLTAIVLLRNCYIIYRKRQQPGSATTKATDS